MIDTSRVTTLVTHDACADGLASAMIVRDALPDVEVIFAQHGTPSLEELAPRAGMLFCDIAPPRARAQAFADAGAIVLDHHKSARDVVELFGDRGVFADEAQTPGCSGAVLAFSAVWLARGGHAGAQTVADFARLVGIRDTWQKTSPSWELACDLHAALMGMPREYWLDGGGIGRALGPDSLYVGGLRRKQRAESIAKICASGILLLRGRDGAEDWAAFPDGGHYTSDAAEALRQAGVRVTVGWFQVVSDGRVHTVLSCRSDGSVDVGELCSRFGGGGHSRAAGCRLELTDPIVAVERVMEAAQ